MNIENNITRKNVKFNEEKEEHDNKEDIVEELTTLLSGMWLELKESLDFLDTISRDDVKEFIALKMKEESKLLVDEFEKDFKGIPDNDPVKFEVLCLLGKLGIEVYDEEEEAKRQYKLKELEKELEKEFRKSKKL